ncbi:MAG: hypothetical protein CVU44_07990 [Chloroflexi bacterium HGW-Chloroflexi-6]|nr:MAG: hypothetical protein CVU44_07990 [Chloroflexi bacterium HGW-Chloroflexi-6]
MSEFFTWLSNNPIATTTFIVSFGVVVTVTSLIYLIAFFKDAKYLFGLPKLLEFPFVFTNNSHSHVVIQNLQLVFLHEKQPRPLSFIATVKKLGRDDDRAFATQFVVPPQEPISLICEFQRNPGGMLFEICDYKIELQAKIEGSDKWRQICRFPLKVNERSVTSINRQFIVHDNMVNS